MITIGMPRMYARNMYQDSCSLIQRHRGHGGDGGDGGDGGAGNVRHRREIYREQP